MTKKAVIISQLKNNTLHITINRPEKHNCFAIPELLEMEQKLLENRANPDVRAVVFRGAGDRSFSTGADLKQFSALDKKGTIGWIQKGQDVFNVIEHYPKPTIAVIQGYALGGGLELALACDFRIASQNATFGNPELRHGWLPGWGGIHRLTKLLGQSRAKEMIYLAEQITAEEAFRIGLINRLTTPENLEKETETILTKLLQLEPDAFSMAKAAISKSGHSNGFDPHEIWYDILSTLYSKKNE